MGFRALLYMTAAVCFIYSPLMFFLRNPPGRQENQVSELDIARGCGAIKVEPA